MEDQPIMSVKIKVLVEHYILVALASAVALYSAGNHNLKTVAISAVTGVLGIIWASVKAKYLAVKEVKALVAGVHGVNLGGGIPVAAPTPGSKPLAK